MGSLISQAQDLAFVPRRDGKQLNGINMGVTDQSLYYKEVPLDTVQIIKCKEAGVKVEG